VRELGGKDDRAERVANADDHHHPNPLDGTALEVEPDEKRYAEGADEQTQVTPSTYALFGSPNPLCDDREEGNGADQETGERTRKVFFCGRHQVPRDAELNDAKYCDPPKILQQQVHLTAPDHQGQQ